MKSFSSTSARKLTFCATCIALATVGELIPLFSLPLGGSVTFFAMLFMVLPGWFYGVPYGVICGLIAGVLNFIITPYYLSFPQFLFDYILAFSVMGMAGLFYKEENSLIKGYLLAVLLRWLMASIAGYFWIQAGSTVWDGWAPFPYTLVYNATYISAEALMTVLVLLIPAVRKALDKVRRSANGL